MPDKPASGDLLRASLTRTEACPPVERIEDADMKSHVEACSYCRSELAMLRSFQNAEVSPVDAAAIAQITERLRPQTFAPAAPKAVEVQSRPSLIERIFGASWLRPAMLAAICALLVVGVVIQMRHRQAGFDPSAAKGESTFRNGTVTINAPIGDLQNAPEEIRWQAVPNVARYRVHLMEVDQHDLWSAESHSTNVAIPHEVRARIVPLKTLLIEVEAFDSTGNKIAHSEIVRFRLLQNLYNR